ncbi:MAG: TatD family hydrolase [Candidatus Roizmanbacteria bacterium]
MYVDTHCHLNFHAFEGGTEKILTRAAAAGVTCIIIPGTDLVTSQKALDIVHEFPQCYAAVGIHPHHVLSYIDTPGALEKDISTLTQMLAQDNVVAIGEIGLDRHVYTVSKYGPEVHVSPEYFSLQLQAFRMQIQLAIQSHKSVVIHNRECSDDILQFFADMSPSDLTLLQNRVVLHCCESDDRLLELAVRQKFFIGVDGDVTFDILKQDFIRRVPLERLVLETDAPYILPEPVRSQKRQPNHPAFIPLIAAKVADLMGVSIEEVARQTTTNAYELYHLPQ